MTNAISIPRRLLVLIVVVPLAALLGYMLSDPLDNSSVVFVAVLLGVLCIPAILKWHHPILLLVWNSGILIYFLPGQPQLWMVFSLISLGVTLLTSTLNKEQKLLNVPAVTWSLLFLFLVVVVTAKMTGGLGVRALGGGVYGGKKYYTIFMAILGYFALSMQPIVPEKVGRYAAFFFLGFSALSLSNIIYYLGPHFYFLYLFFPIDLATNQAMEDMQIHATMSRLSGLAFAAMGGFCYMQMKYGIKGHLDLRKPWRLLIFMAVMGVSLLGGFRAVLVLYLIILFVQYGVEGLWRTKLTLYLGISGLILLVVMGAFSSKLPMTVQRSISFIPGLDVDERARADAQASIDWRLRMWSLLYPEIPRYFWLGKGYTTSATDMHLAIESTQRGFGEGVESSLISGDYHNGPLSLLVPFGIWGVLAFALFVVASIKTLRANFRYGDPRFHSLNAFLLSLFIGRVIFFVVFYGAISTDLASLAGIVGLSVAVNRGKRQPQVPSKAGEDEAVLSLEKARMTGAPSLTGS